MEFSVNGEYNIKTFATHFPPLFFCIAALKSLRFSRLFQTYLLNYFFLNAFVNPKKKSHLKIVVPEVQETILYGT